MEPLKNMRYEYFSFYELHCDFAILQTICSAEFLYTSNGEELHISSSIFVLAFAFFAMNFIDYEHNVFEKLPDSGSSKVVLNLSSTVHYDYAYNKGAVYGLQLLFSAPQTDCLQFHKDNL